MTKIRIVFNAFRVKFLERFFPRYVKQSLTKRKGKCKQCGKCCLDCKYLKRKNNKKICSIHSNIKLRKKIGCHINFPIDKFDRDTLNPDDCGYYWPGEKKRK